MSNTKVKNYQEQVAIKHDNNKLRYSLVPSKPITDLVKVLMFGAAKYGDYNWTGGFDWTRLYDATQRHLQAWVSGETTDPESGLNHLSHAMCNIAFLLEFEKTHPERDDRHVSKGKK
jgi:Domain of unknown function (DUF5664)